MITTRNYDKGNYENIGLIPLTDVGSGVNYFTLDALGFRFALSDVQFFEDAGGAIEITNTNYTLTEFTTYTDMEAESGGSSKTIFSKFQITNAVYQTGTIYVTGNSFGALTDNDILYLTDSQASGPYTIGGLLTVTTGGMSITGNSSITGTLNVIGETTVSNHLIISAGGADISGQVNLTTNLDLNLLNLTTSKADGVVGLTLNNDVQNWGIQTKGTSSDRWELVNNTLSVVPFSVATNTPADCLVLSNQGLSKTGAEKSNVQVVTTDTTIDYTSDLIEVNTATATITLPDLSSNLGRHITIRKISNSTGTVSIVPSGADVISSDGLTTFGLTTEKDYVTIFGSTNYWEILGISDWMDQKVTDLAITQALVFS